MTCWGGVILDGSAGIKISACTSDGDSAVYLSDLSFGDSGEIEVR